MMSGGWVRNEPWKRPRNWDAIKSTVRTRSGGRCEIWSGGIRCPNPATSCDHITPAYVAGADVDPADCQDICTPHHKQKSAYEGVQAAAQRRARNYRPKPQHPGLRRNQ